MKKDKKKNPAERKRLPTWLLLLIILLAIFFGITFAWYMVYVIVICENDCDESYFDFLKYCKDVIVLLFETAMDAIRR